MAIFIPAVLCIAAVLAQDVFPGRPWFHHGSYVAVLVVLIIWQWWAVRRSPGLRTIVAGATIVGAAGLASSLFAPDLQTIVRGPGESVPLTEPAGILQFRLSKPATAPVLERPGRKDVPVDAGHRTYLASYVLWSELRPSALVEVFDARGARLTITQPSNTSFLSPVLLFAGTTSIAGRDLPVDSFAVPAAHRSVKAVLFSSAEVARMARLSPDPRPGILFAVEDERGSLIPGAIGMARDGEVIREAGLRLRASILPFPTVVVAAVPYLPVVLVGLAVVAFGSLRSRFRS